MHRAILFLPLLLITTWMFYPCEKSDGVKKVDLIFKPTSIKAPLVEQFTEDLTDRWIRSLAQEFDDVTEGKWSVEEHIAYPTVKGNKGLVAKTKAAYHAISTSFSDPIDPTKPLIIQFEVKFQRDGDCGRGFIKLLEDGSQTNDIDVDGEIPWVVSFGPEFRCPGSVVHYIRRRKNHQTDSYKVKHVEVAFDVTPEKLTTLYTLIVRPDSTFQIFVNHNVIARGSDKHDVKEHDTNWEQSGQGIACFNPRWSDDSDKDVMLKTPYMGECYPVVSYEPVDPLGGVTVEVVTMQGNVSIDNIYVGHSESDASALAAETFDEIRVAEAAAANVTVLLAEDFPKEIFRESQELIGKKCLPFLDLAKIHPVFALELEPEMGDELIKEYVGLYRRFEGVDDAGGVRFQIRDYDFYRRGRHTAPSAMYFSSVQHFLPLAEIAPVLAFKLCPECGAALFSMLFRICHEAADPVDKDVSKEHDDLVASMMRSFLPFSKFLEFATANSILAFESRPETGAALIGGLFTLCEAANAQGPSPMTKFDPEERSFTGTFRRTMVFLEAAQINPVWAFKLNPNTGHLLIDSILIEGEVHRDTRAYSIHISVDRKYTSFLKHAKFAPVEAFCSEPKTGSMLLRDVLKRWREFEDTIDVDPRAEAGDKDQSKGAFTEGVMTSVKDQYLPFMEFLEFAKFDPIQAFSSEPETGDELINNLFVLWQRVETALKNASEGFGRKNSSSIVALRDGILPLLELPENEPDLEFKQKRKMGLTFLRVLFTLDQMAEMKATNVMDPLAVADENAGGIHFQGNITKLAMHTKSSDPTKPDHVQVSQEMPRDHIAFFTTLFTLGILSAMVWVACKTQQRAIKSTEPPFSIDRRRKAPLVTAVETDEGGVGKRVTIGNFLDRSEGTLPPDDVIRAHLGRLT